MTERSEVVEMIDDVKDVLDRMDYEIATRPGNGAEFVKSMSEAADLLRVAITFLGKAEKTF